VKETQVLLDVTSPLASVVAQRAAVLTWLRGLLDMASQGGAFGETLVALGAKKPFSTICGSFVADTS
jgi:hypothetical protein